MSLLRRTILLLALLTGCGSGGSGDGGVGGTSGTGGTGGAGGAGGRGGGADAGSDAGSLGPDADADVDAGPPLAACRAPLPPPPDCGSAETGWSGLFDDSVISDKARRFDRQFHAINAFATGLNTDLTVPETSTADRDLVNRFVNEHDGWDFEAFAGKPVTDVVTSWSKSTGAYAGAGVAADAYRYLTLRYRGAACADVDIARAHLERDLEALHVATQITGVEGVIARAFGRTDLPGNGQVATTPLFDTDGSPLPPEKDNGTWRDDQSGELPQYAWEDSASRDQLVGWILGYAATWEAIRDDPTFDDALKERLRDDAAAIGRSLMQTGEEGFDLEIRDADGRRTYHGILHEESIDRAYTPTAALNGFNATLAIGIVGAIDWMTDDAEIGTYLRDVLIGERRLHELSRDQMNFVDLGEASNYSAYNMAFQGGLLAIRYLCDDEARDVVREAMQSSLYDRGGDRQPSEQKQSFYDVVYVAAKADINAWTSAAEGAGTGIDEAALDRALETLADYPDPPYFGGERINCDDAELAAGSCTGLDGSSIDVLGNVGRNGALVAAAPVPISIRPKSNYYWRSNPYEVNGGPGADGLFPASDFRLVYWFGRWAHR